MDNNCTASSKKMQNGREKGPCYFDHLKCKGVSFQRISDVPGVAYFVQREEGERADIVLREKG